MTEWPQLCYSWTWNEVLGGIILVCLVLGIAFFGIFAYWNLKSEIDALKKKRRQRRKK